MNQQSAEAWAQDQWGAVELGDARRNARAVEVGAAIARHPEGSLPAQLEGWNELRAAYRLLNSEEVSHASLSQPHWQKTRQQAQQQGPGVVLFIQDTTEVDYSGHRQTQGLGVIGKGTTQGLLLHSCLAVVPEANNPTILGLAGQMVWSRAHAPANEGDKWAELVECMGPLPEATATWVSVGDRESDVFSYLRRCQALGWQTLLRVSQNRVVSTAGLARSHLKTYARSLAAQAQKSLSLRGREGQPQRDLSLKVAWSALRIHPPYAERHQAPIPVWCIRCWEDAPEGLEWILVTTLDPTVHPVLSQIEWYACRWLIEEYHKCLKSGCRAESRQLETATGLMRLLAFLGITAVRLLQLRMLSRRTPDLPADAVVPAPVLNLLAARLRLTSPPKTVAEFWRAVARLGGFIGRAADGQPGWQTLWRGWLRLQDLTWALHLSSDPSSCW